MVNNKYRRKQQKHHHIFNEKHSINLENCYRVICETARCLKRSEIIKLDSNNLADYLHDLPEIGLTDPLMKEMNQELYQYAKMI